MSSSSVLNSVLLLLLVSEGFVFDNVILPDFEFFEFFERFEPLFEDEFGPFELESDFERVADPWKGSFPYNTNPVNCPGSPLTAKMNIFSPSNKL